MHAKVQSTNMQEEENLGGLRQGKRIILKRIFKKQDVWSQVAHFKVRYKVLVNTAINLCGLESSKIFFHQQTSEEVSAPRSFAATNNRDAIWTVRHKK